MINAIYGFLPHITYSGNKNRYFMPRMHECLFIIRELVAYFFCHECMNVCFIERQSIFRLNSNIICKTYFVTPPKFEFLVRILIINILHF